MYLIIGGSGFLGSYIIQTILNMTSERIVATCRNISNVPDFDGDMVSWQVCDVTDYSQVKNLNRQMAEQERQYKVIYLAAYHNPDLVEKNPRLGWDVNVTSLSFFLNCMDGVETLFYPSSDSVYGNSKDGYAFCEDDPLDPVNAYGRQKAVAEALVTGYGYHAVRFPFLIGSSLLKSRKHFYDVIVEKICSGEGIEMFADSYRSTLHFRQAAELLIQLMEEHSEDCPPIVNICGDEGLSKYDVGRAIAGRFGQDGGVIRPVSLDDGIDGVFEGKRAKSTLMDNSRLKRLLGLQEIKFSL